MAQQYPPASSYGAQYAQGHVHPAYGPTTLSANTPAGGLQQNMQQQPIVHVPSPSQNSQRYEMNAQIAAAPLPFHFPSNLNPDFFKQLANSSLPPPPPPPNFTPASITPANFPIPAQKYPFSASPIPHPNPYLYGIASSQSSLGSAPPVYGSSSMAGDGNNTLPNLGTLNEKEKTPLATSFASIQPGRSKVLPHTLDGAGMSNPTHDAMDFTTSNQEQALLQDQVSSQLQTELRTHSRENYQHPLHNQDDIRERAKAAIMLLVSSGITYEDFLREGVNAYVIESLFDELSLDKSETSIPTQAVQTDLKREVPQQSSSNISVTEHPTTEATLQPTLDAGMERKDRIARLLAARKGQGSIGGKLSQSASPATTPGSQTAQPVTSSAEMPATQIRQVISQPLSDVNESRLGPVKIPIGESHASSHDIEMSYRSLPTPIRTQLEQSGMSALIPGLFMTSADLSDNQSIMRDVLVDRHNAENQRRQKVDVESFATQSAEAKVNISPNSRKRASEALDDEFLPNTKRSALEHEDHVEVEMEVSRSDIDESEGSEEGEYNPEDSERNEDTYNQMKNSTDTTDVALVISQPGSNLQSELYPKTNDVYSQLSTKQQGFIDTKQQPPVESQLISTVTASTGFQAEHVVGSANVAQRNESSRDANSEKINAIASPKGAKVDAGKLAARMAALKANLVAKNARKRALQEGMPVLDAEIQNTRAELAQFQADLTRTRANITERSIELAKAKSQEHDLLQKIQGLEQQLNDGVSGQKQFSNELNQLNDQIRAGETGSYVSEEKDGPISTGASKHIGNNKPDSEPHFVEVDHDSTRNENVVSDQASHSEFSDTDNNQRKQAQQEDDFPKDGAVQKDGQHNTGLAENIPYDGSENDESTSPNAYETSIANSDDDQMSIDEESEEESSNESNGSASMSDSGSEEYDPERENEKSKEEKADESDYEPEDTHMAEMQEERHNDGDDYEPSEEVDVLDTAELESLRREHDSSAATSNHQGEPLTNGTGNATPASERPISPVKALNESNRRKSDQTLESKEADPSSHAALGDNTKPGPARFVPYRSPLTPWKSFRFHSQFNDLIKSGYRSLTYSNQIDPKRPLCPTELAGDICTDASCEEQHFGSMALSDDKILVQMSSADDLKDKAQRDAYLIGLKEVIADLRGRGVKEFSEVADALSRYRREWMEAQLAAST